MAHFQKLKNQARREEQRSNWAGAIELYKQAIKLDEDVSSSVDLNLYNRIGDLHLRLNDPAVAVEYYETTVNLYADQDMHTSAIALCNKILRIMPDHTRTYRRLGRLHAQTGLLAESRANYLQFARRTQEAGELGDALEALQEFVDLTNDEGIRRSFAESLVERGLPAEAVAQLRLVWESLVARGSDAEDVRARILEIDAGEDPLNTQTPEQAREAGEPAPRPDIILGIQDAETLTDDSSGSGRKVATAGTEVTDAPSVAGTPSAAEPVTEPEHQIDRDGTMNLARLINEELGDVIGIDEATPAVDVDVAVSKAAEAESPAETIGGLHRSTIDEFREEIGRIVDESDYSVHYDLGVAYMSMGLIDEALVEFQSAIQGETYLTAAHEMIGKCLELRAGLEPPRSTVPAPTPQPTGEERIEESEPEPVVDPQPAPVVESEVVEPQPEPASSSATNDRSNDALAKLLFEARLAQFRARKAESQHDTDYQAHLDLGVAYQEMRLIEEALREYQVAVGGSRTIAARVMNALEKIARDGAVADDMRLLALELIPDGQRQEVVLVQYLQMHDRWLEAGRDCSILREHIQAIDPEAVPVMPEHLDISAEQLPELDDILSELGPLDLHSGLVRSLPDLLEATDMPEPPPEVVTLDMVPLDEIEDLMAAGPDSPAAELAMLDPPSTPEVAPAQQPAAKATESQGEKALQVALEHLEAGDIPRADTELRTALRLFEEDAEHRKALSVLDALLSLNGDDVVLHHQKAEYAITLNDRATLIRSYMDLGATLRRQAAPRSARSVYGRVLEIDPENADALQAIADLDDIELEQERERRPAVRPAAQTERADFDGLLDDLKTQVSEQASDTDYDSHLALGLSFKARGMLDEAIRELQIAVRGLADPLAAYEALGEAFISNGQPGIAYRALEKAVHLEGNDERKVGCLYWLGVAAQEQGELSRARAFFERVMTVDIDYRDTGTRITDCAS